MITHLRMKTWGIVLAQSFFLIGMGLFLGTFLVSGGKMETGDLKGIINSHEHIESEAEALRYLEEAKKHHIARTVVLGSPEATLVPGKTGFAHEDENNREILRFSKKYPGKFIIFPTVNPGNPDKLKLFEEYVRLGARGLKLYSGHKIFHDLPLDDRSMDTLYGYCETHQLPVMFHVNAALYQQEFENVLNRFPRLKVICPHFCLSTIRTDRFQSLMDRHPNLYTDVSFGYVGFLNEALIRFSSNPAAYRTLILKYQNRILFGLDLAVTRESYKTAAWLNEMMQVYRDFLEKDHFNFSGLPQIQLRGFNLDTPVLEKIYFKNFEKLMSRREN